jgi:hypothetical protein
MHASIKPQSCQDPEMKQKAQIESQKFQEKYGYTTTENDDYDDDDKKKKKWL